MQTGLVVEYEENIRVLLTHTLDSFTRAHLDCIPPQRSEWEICIKNEVTLGLGRYGFRDHPEWTWRKRVQYRQYLISTMIENEKQYAAKKDVYTALIQMHNVIEDSLLIVERRHTFAMLTHLRVGKNAILGRLPTDLIARLFKESTKIKRDITDTSGRYAKLDTGKWIEEVD
jgi:hypothetical protein